MDEFVYWADRGVACSGFTGETEDRDATFVVGSSPRLVVSGENGRIIVNPGPNDTVRVQAVLKSPDKVKYEIRQEGDVITVKAETESRGIFNFGKSIGVDLEITAPPNTRVDLQTNNGQVGVDGMHKSGSVRTSNGAIVMNDVIGEFSISTSNGSVTVTQARGSFDIETSNGKIEFAGDLTSSSNNRMTSSNGRIDIKLLGTPGVKLDASTSNGSINTELPILMTSRLNESHLVGTIGDGGAELFVKTSNGSIVVK